MKAVKRDAREMKDSGIDIIGEYPRQWRIKRLKFLTDIDTGNKNTQDAIDNGVYPFYVRSPIIEKSNDYTFEGEGILMAGDGAGAGRVFHHAYGKYAIHQRVYCLHDFSDVNTSYLFYFLSNRFCDEMDKGSAQSTVPSIRLSMLTDFSVCIPEVTEQQIIADYLDDRCAKIDAIIAEAKASIEEYKELKQAVIYEAVTKGLDKNVAMKDSFEKWIGKYPAHYQLIQVSRLATIVRGGSPRPAGDPRYYGGDIPFLKIADVTKDEKMYVYECKNTITYAGLSRTRTIQANTLLLTNSGATLGIPKITTFKTTFNDGIAAFLDLSDKLVMEFAYYFLKARTKYYQEYASMGMGQPNLNTNIIGRTHIVLPPLNEQKEIVEYLNHITQNIDELITQKQSLIEDLESYKKSLIYEVVTGKRKVVAG